VYKGQGRIRRELVTRAYGEFLVHEGEFQASIPSTVRIDMIPWAHFGPGSQRGRPRGDAGLFSLHAARTIVARVRPRTSKGITDLLLPRFTQLSAALSL
jgi:hypothetical protein